MHGTLDVSPARVNRQLYADFDPIEAPAFTAKTDLLAEIDAYCRAKDPRVVQVVGHSGRRAPRARPSCAPTAPGSTITARWCGSTCR